MTQWHVLAPAVDGGWNSIDYTNNLATAVRLARYWRLQGEQKGTLRIAKGKNGTPLRYVVWYQTADTQGDTYVSAHATLLGAKRAYLKLGRTFPNSFTEYGFREVDS